MSEQNLEINSELAPQHKPEFDGGSFTIEYLSRSAEGFEIKTNNSDRRRKPVEPIQEDQSPLRKPLPFDKAQTELLRKAMPGQIRYAKGNDAQQALTELRTTQSNDVSKEAREDVYANYQKKRRLYRERMTPSVGITNVHQEGNTLTLDIKPADFPVYREFAKPDSSPEVLEFASRISATAIVLTTKDERLIIQLRSLRNALYGGILGTSAAGYLQGKMYRPEPQQEPTQQRGTLLPVDTDFVKENIVREIQEEIGLEEKDIDNLRIVGLAKDNVRVHYEFSLLGKTNLSLQQIQEKASRKNIDAKLKDVEFTERFVSIPATPEAIAVLLSQVKCPFPPTQYAALVAGGYSMMLEEQGKEQADNWMKRLELKVQQNYQEIDFTVAKYYEENPEIFQQIPEGKPARNPRGYEPAYLPQEQGLPDPISELKRVGLI